MVSPTNFLYPITDYYYYATAGGAKIWVSSLPHNYRYLPDLYYFLLQWKKYLTTMQIVQFIVDLHLVYFGSESNVSDVAIHLILSSSQPIATLPPPIGLNFRHLATAMERSRPQSLAASYSRAIFCSLSSSILIRTRSRLAERSQLRMDTQMGTGESISNFDSDPRLMTLRRFKKD
jgi:hypothetical protein